jgi:hypothetical protein
MAIRQRKTVGREYESRSGPVPSVDFDDRRPHILDGIDDGSRVSVEQDIIRLDITEILGMEIFTNSSLAEIAILGREFDLWMAHTAIVRTGRLGDTTHSGRAQLGCSGRKGKR